MLEFYRHQEKRDEFPCQLSRPCPAPAGQFPPPLSLSAGYTNVLHQTISSGLSVSSRQHFTLDQFLDQVASQSETTNSRSR